MNNAESGRVTVREAEFEELLRTAYESKQSNSIDERKQPKSPREDVEKQHSLSCM